MIVLLWAFNCMSLYTVMYTLNAKKLPFIGKWFMVCILQFFLYQLTNHDQLILVLFYALLYLIKLLVFQILMKQNHHWRFIVTNINYITMISCHLISIAVIALCYQSDMSSVILTKEFKLICYILFLLLDTLVNIFIILKKTLFTKLFSQDIHREYHSFENFLWFGCSFLLVQGILCQYDHFPIYTSIFLICNDLLLLIMIFCFIRNIYEIQEQTYVEQEHEILQSEAEIRKKSMQDMKRSADYDILTNTHSRRYMMEVLEQLKNKQQMFSIVFIDLDRLKTINDQHGHAAGDQYLRSFAESMELFLQEGDILGRIGGDEFLVIMKNSSLREAHKRMEEIYAKISQNASSYFSYGVASSGPGTYNIEELLRIADEAMYRQKEKHRRDAI